MADKNSKTVSKRPSKGQRTHVRRLKQVASKDANISSSQSTTPQSVRVRKKQRPGEEK